MLHQIHITAMIRIVIVVGILCMPVVGFGQGNGRIGPGSEQGDVGLLGQSPTTGQKLNKKKERSVKIKFNIKDSAIGYVITQLAKISGNPLVFKQSDSLFAKKISVAIDTDDIMAAMKTTLRGTGLVATLGNDGETIVVAQPLEPVKQEQVQNSQKSISGRVMDSATGKPLSGASVTLVAKRLTATTDDKGEFRLTGIESGEYSITVRMFGYRVISRTINIGNESTTKADFVMTYMPNQLNEVVTSATGRQMRREVVNDVTKINVEEVIRNNPVSTVSELLTTRVPGLHAAKTSGQPGDPTRIRIRGVSSINTSNEPMIIVDGLEVRNEAGAASSSYTGNALSPLDQIDVNSIESVEVLKGPSAVALYGSDAANGVIVVTTKKGIPGTHRYSAAVKKEMSTMPGEWPLNYFAWGTYPATGLTEQQCSRSLWATAFPCVVDSISVYQILNDPHTTTLGRGSKDQISLGFTGGANAVRYSVTLSSDQEIGLTKLPDADVEMLKSENQQVSGRVRRPHRLGRTSGTSRFDFDVSTITRLGLSVGVTHSQKYASPLSSSGERAGVLPPARQEFGPGGELLPTGSGLLTGSGGFRNFREKQVDREQGLRLGAEITSLFRNSWHTRVSGGMDHRSTNGERSLPNGACYRSISCSGVAYDTGSMQSTLGSAIRWNSVINVSGQPFGHKYLSVTPVIGMNYTRSSERSYSVSGIGLPKGATSSDGAFLHTYKTSNNNRNTLGGYIEARLKLADRLWIPISLRADGGSALGSSVMPKFPKLGFSYVVSDNPSFEHIPLLGKLPSLRIRTAFGVAGKQPLGVEKYRTYNSGGGLFGVGNPYLMPERSSEWEYGSEVQVIDHSRGSLNVNATFARKTTKDLLISEDLPPSLGGFTQQINLGDVSNKSVEIDIESYLDIGIVVWNSGLSLTHARNKLNRLGVNYNENITAAGLNGVVNRHVVGYPVSSRWTRQLISYSDRNNDGIIEADEVVKSDSLVYVGAPFPKFQLNTHQQLTVNSSLTVSSVFSYDHGVTQNRGVPTYPRTSADPSLPLDVQAYSAHSNLAYVQTVSSLRWNSLQISYTIPKSLSSRLLGKQTASISAFGTNLNLWSNYRGKDPNVGARGRDPQGGSNGETFSDQGQLPSPRNIGIQVRLH